MGTNFIACEAHACWRVRTPTATVAVHRMQNSACAHVSCSLLYEGHSSTTPVIAPWLVKTAVPVVYWIKRIGVLTVRGREIAVFIDVMLPSG